MNIYRELEECLAMLEVTFGQTYWIKMYADSSGAIVTHWDISTRDVCGFDKNGITYATLKGEEATEAEIKCLLSFKTRARFHEVTTLSEEVNKLLPFEYTDVRLESTTHSSMYIDTVGHPDMPANYSLGIAFLVVQPEYKVVRAAFTYREGSLFSVSLTHYIRDKVETILV